MSHEVSNSILALAFAYKLHVLGNSLWFISCRGGNDRQCHNCTWADVVQHTTKAHSALRKQVLDASSQCQFSTQVLNASSECNFERKLLKQVLNASSERKVITEAAEAGEPLLFFCKIGKDRTGVLAALLLSCCGAKPEEIIADYHRCSSSSSSTAITASCFWLLMS